jgi:pimeloyl-ACP methyl ester carboxylesterase
VYVPPTTSEGAWERLAGDGPYGVVSQAELDHLAARIATSPADGPGSEIRTAITGRGNPPFVLLHGLGGRWQHWLPAMTRLSNRRQAVALDLPGFGESAALPGRVSVDALVDRVAVALDRAEVEPAIVFGHSLGATLALRLALRHPARVRGVVLVAGTIQSFAGVLSPGGALRLAKRSPAVLGAVLTEVLTAGLPAPRFLRELIIARPRLRRVILSPYVADPAALPAASARLLVEGAGAPGVVPTFRAINAVDPLAGLELLAGRVAAIAGADDLIAPGFDLAEVHERFADLPIWEIEGAGHMPMLERVDAFVSACEAAASYLTNQSTPMEGESNR